MFVVWAGLVPFALAINVGAGHLLPELPVVLRTILTTAVLVPLTVYVGIPAVRWIVFRFAPPAGDRGADRPARGRTRLSRGRPAGTTRGDLTAPSRRSRLAVHEASHTGVLQSLAADVVVVGDLLVGLPARHLLGGQLPELGVVTAEAPTGPLGR